MSSTPYDEDVRKNEREAKAMQTKPVGCPFCGGIVYRHKAGENHCGRCKSVYEAKPTKSGRIVRALYTPLSAEKVKKIRTGAHIVFCDIDKMFQREEENAREKS